MKIFALTFSLICLFTCCSRTNDQNSLYTSIPVNTEVVPFSLASISDNTRYVKLETNDSCLIGNIFDVHYTGKYIIIESDNSILFFDNEGRFSHKIYRQGSGPEEYISMSSAFISSKENTVYILDARKKQIIQYDFNGTFKQQMPLPPYWIIDMQQLNDSTWILYRGNQSSADNKNKFITYNSRTQEWGNGFYPIADNKSKFLHIHTTNFGSCGEELLFAEFYNDTIYHLTESGCSPLYYFDFGTDKIPSSYMTADYQNIAEFQQRIMSNNFVYGMGTLINLPNSLLLSYYAGKHNYLYYSKLSKTATSFYQVTDEPFWGDCKIDTRKYHMEFYADNNYLISIADNLLYIDKAAQITDPDLKNALVDMNEENNPVVRISRIKDTAK